MKTNDIGRISELLAFAKFIELGYVVSTPINKDGIYDCIIEKDNSFKRIQIKTARLLKNNHISVSMKSTSHNRIKNTLKYYTSKEVDYICGVFQKENKVYLIPVETRKNEIRFSIDSEYLI